VTDAPVTAPEPDHYSSHRMPVFRVNADDRERLANAAAADLDVEGMPSPDEQVGWLPEWAKAIVAIAGDDFETGVELTDPTQIRMLKTWVGAYAPGTVVES
jgi:hypothetical protein